MHNGQWLVDNGIFVLPHSLAVGILVFLLMSYAVCPLFVCLTMMAYAHCLVYSVFMAWGLCPRVMCRMYNVSYVFMSVSVLCLHVF